MIGSPSRTSYTPHKFTPTLNVVWIKQSHRLELQQKWNEQDGETLDQF
jgi:hypothetical protein